MRSSNPLFVAAFLIAFALGESIVSVGQEPAPQTPPVLLQMIRDSAVHQELEISRDQQQQIYAALEKVDGRWFRARNLPAEKQQNEIRQLTRQIRQEAGRILQSRQFDRLSQLERQALGTRMALLEEVSSRLGLSSEQVLKLREAFSETDRRAAEIQKAVNAGDKDGAAGGREVDRLKQAERETLLKVLKPEQQSMLGGLTGRPFDFGQVKRTYPLAPELETAGVTWIQGGPVKLDQLRGQGRRRPLLCLPVHQLPTKSASLQGVA